MVREGNAEIIVAGSGPAGLAAALALAHAGRSVALVGPPPPGIDRRTTALMKPALEFLGTLGLGAELSRAGTPLRTMRIIDASRRLLRSPVVTFHASEIGEDAFGLNIPNEALNAALANAVRTTPGISWHQTTVSDWVPGANSIAAELADGTMLEAALAVGADGRASPAREAAGIGTAAHAYPQSALVLNFAHSRGHAFTSTEFHTETGPFTQVPLAGNRSSLVWVVAPRTALELKALSDDELSRRIEERMQSMLGRVTVEPGRQVYPLSGRLPDRFAARRIALVGEAAHVFPPIGAQGLNLGLRDVKDLAASIAGAIDPGADRVLRTYHARRLPDVLARSGAVDLLNRSLLSSALPVQMLRSAGLGALGLLAPLRGFFMREGLQPGSGFPGVLADLRKQVGR